MNNNLVIPDSHWNTGDHYTRGFIPGWEKQLRGCIAAQPDPAKRFTEWLATKAKGEFTPGVRLVLIEEPYLKWALAVEQVIETAEKELRQRIAYEITNPDDR